MRIQFTTTLEKQQELKDKLKDLLIIEKELIEEGKVNIIALATPSHFRDINVICKNSSYNLDVLQHVVKNDQDDIANNDQNDDE